MKGLRNISAAAATAVALSGCAGMYTQDGQPNDPWEGFNRGVFAFNDTLDHYAFRPVARGYDAVTPDPVQDGVRNFFGNIGDVGTTVNGVLQGNPMIVGTSLSRVLLNTTLGIGGLLDPASRLGIEKRHEDFGKTFAAWGFKSGPFMMLPLLGPSTVRDTMGLPGDWFSDAVTYIDNSYARWGLRAVDLVQVRADLLDQEKLMQNGDRYTFIRDAWMQRRQFEIDGNKVTNDPFAAGADSDDFSAPEATGDDGAAANDNGGSGSAAAPEGSTAR
ncbi:MlaA family lipoprotein [Carnimonas nigrificans]|uniref:MlaA family lipoprotein n=1 Tax=Carnimonas nigrificans TaxID=64323 RepID=UPI00046F35F9|nr:VacJ family lipoprotein [Carnimonas nigrificans]